MKMIRRIALFILFTSISSPLLASGMFKVFASKFRSIFVSNQEVKSQSRVELEKFANKRNLYVPGDIVETIFDYVGEPPHFKIRKFKRNNRTLTFKDMSPEDSRRIYRHELNRAVEKGEEPRYLKRILDARAFEITTLIESKETDLSEGAWIEHAHNILNVMYATNRVAMDAVTDAAESAAFDRAGPSLVTSSSASSSAWFAASSSAWFAALSAADSASNSAAWFAARSSARNATSKELSHLKLKAPDKIAKHAYRIAEKAVLIYFLQHEREIFDAAYQASSEKLWVPNSDVFCPGAWEEFRKKHFGNLSTEEYLFLQPYLEAIDWIVNNKIGSNSKRT